ncbi:MAG: sigma-70 family RNA polymerase sigma factor, partial [Candidatus Dormibacter sp.]
PGADDTVAMLNSNAAGSVPTTSPAAERIDHATERFAAIYDRFGGLAFTLAHRIVRDRGIAEDVVQESFLAIWRNAERYDAGRGSMQAWLCRIVRNRALDRLRGTSRRARDHRSLDDLTYLASSEDVVADVLQRDEGRSVAAAVAALPAGQREAIQLAYYAGYSQTEIATRTGLPLGTIKGRTRAALRALTTSLDALESTSAEVGDLIKAPLQSRQPCGSRRTAS